MRRERRYKSTKKKEKAMRLLIMIKKGDVKSQICHKDGREQ